MAAIFLIALLDNTFKSEEDIEKTLGLVTWYYPYHRKLQKERIVYGKILSEK